MKGRSRGLFLFILVVAAVGVWEFVLQGGADRTGKDWSGGGLAAIFGTTIEVSGIVESEKTLFLEDPEVQEILNDRYGIAVDFQTAGSFEMLDRELDGVDFLWPSSQVAADLYRQERGAPLEEALVFNSPLVFYSWTPIVDAMAARGLVDADGEVDRVPLRPLLREIGSGTTWTRLGVESVFGAFQITSTDPLRFGSGNMYAGLIANTLTGGVAGDTALRKVLPDVVDLFRRQGQIEYSTEALFDRYIKLGVAQYPMIVGYESQYIEFSQQNQDLWRDMRDQIALVYPVPTVWSSHPVLALSEDGQRLIEALDDADVREIAWRRHGFRSGPIGIGAAADLGLQRVAPEVTQVVQTPGPAEMVEIMAALEGGGKKR